MLLPGYLRCRIRACCMMRSVITSRGMTILRKTQGQPSPSRSTTRIAKFPRPITTTRIRPLTGHVFTDGYTARFRPRSLDPHQCQCGEPLRTAHHVIAACPLHAELRRQFLLPVSHTLLIPAIFATKEGGSARDTS
jgi:hypothetical protein